MVASVLQWGRCLLTRDYSVGELIAAAFSAATPDVGMRSSGGPRPDWWQSVAAALAHARPRIGVELLLARYAEDEAAAVRAQYGLSTWAAQRYAAQNRPASAYDALALMVVRGFVAGKKVDADRGKGASSTRRPPLSVAEHLREVADLWAAAAARAVQIQLGAWPDDA